MSQADEGSPTDTELATENESPTRAPTSIAQSQDEAPTDITASPAFQCLDELFSAGKITDTRVAKLKEEYTRLHKAVISLQESETQLLQEAECLSAELEQCELEKAEQFPDEASSEASQIRQQLLSCRSEYNVVKGRVYENRLKVECLREEKKLLENEYERMLKEKEMISDMDARVLEECIAEERLLFKEQEKCRNELSTLTHLTWLRADEKQLKCRNVQKAKIQLQSVVKELKRKDRELITCKKMKKEIQKELQGFATMYDLMQTEKENCIQLMQTAQSKAREAENRVKLLENRIENLRNAVANKERKLQEEYAKIKKNERMTELIKKDYYKVEQEMLENKEKEKYLNVDRLTTIATHMEEEILQLRKKCERAIQQQNESGLLLREREEELGFLYEKIKRQEMLCRNGDIKMQAMDEKISFLKLKVAEKKRETKLFFKELPVRNALDAHLVRLQIQYSQCKDKIKQLEENHGDATNESRKKEMGGKDPSPPELLKRIKQIEAELVRKEQRLLKIDFLCENISDLTDRIRAMVENGKQDMLLFTRRTNELQKKINDKTREIRALFAELSMKQALAIKLQQEIRDKEQFVMTASLTLSQGLPPPIEAEKKRWKIAHSEKMQKVAAEARAKRPAEEEQGAVPRHASAIPEEGRLPLLQPHVAPLRPSEPSSSPRHLKKPPAKLPEI